MSSRASVSLLLVCPSDVIRLQGLPLVLQEFRVPENLGPVVPLHDEGPVGAVLAGSLPPDGALDVPVRRICPQSQSCLGKSVPF